MLLKSFRNNKVNPEFKQTLISIIGFKPKNAILYQSALTHKSVKEVDSYGISINNERLEFLGDSVIDTVIADFLFNKYPKEDEGFLTNLRSKIVKRTHLDKLGKSINLDILIKASARNSSVTSHILGNALEALVGAIYLDRGYKYASYFIIEILLKKHVNLQELKDTEDNFKSLLIEFAQHNRITLDFKTEILKSENSSVKKFESIVIFDGEEKGRGIGFSKKEAEQKASQISLKNIQNN